MGDKSPKSKERQKQQATKRNEQKKSDAKIKAERTAPPKQK